MTTQPIHRKRRQEIPDAQIKDAADQYEEARRILSVLPPGTGVLLPELNCTLIAIELYLKSLAAERIFTPEEDGVQLVTARSLRGGHGLSVLLDALQEPIRSRLDQAGDQEFQDLGLTFRNAIERCDGIFQASRYSYEWGKGSKIREAPLDLLHRCSDFLSRYVAELEPQEYIHC